MTKKYVYLNMNMLDENEREIFQSLIPYEIKCDFIENEDGLKIKVVDIWVDFEVLHIAPIKQK